MATSSMSSKRQRLHINLCRGLKRQKRWSTDDSDDSRDVSDTESGDIKPDVVIHKRPHVPEGQSSLHRASCIQLFFNGPESLLHCVKESCPPDELFSKPPALLTQIENCPSFLFVKKIFNAYLGDLTLVDCEGSNEYAWVSVTGDADPTCDTSDEPVNSAVRKEFIRGVDIIREGYTSAAANGFGRNALHQILKICQQITEYELQVSESNIIYVKNGGQYNRKESKSDASTFLYNDSDYVNWRPPDVEPILTCIRKGQTSVTGTNKESNPDVAVYIRELRSKVRHYLFIGEVKSYGDTNTCAIQAWTQALVGLKNLDITYGILFETTKITLYKLQKEKCSMKNLFDVGVQELHTSICEWQLLKGAMYMFDVDKLLSFMKTVICIMCAQVKRN